MVVGFKDAISRFGEFLKPFALLVFVGLSATVTLVAFLGRAAQKNREN